MTCVCVCVCVHEANVFDFVSLKSMIQFVYL